MRTEHRTGRSRPNRRARGAIPPCRSTSASAPTDPVPVSRPWDRRVRGRTPRTARDVPRRPGCRDDRPPLRRNAGESARPDRPENARQRRRHDPASGAMRFYRQLPAPRRSAFARPHRRRMPPGQADARSSPRTPAGRPAPPAPRVRAASGKGLWSAVRTGPAWSERSSRHLSVDDGRVCGRNVSSTPGTTIMSNSYIFIIDDF